ncbi:mucin-4 isoform X2 [Erinaceus europaeus]|uniref:Mucin-4 isoform X2 n=1 Tax=Erinaceus europaeus TaxID=9365 RepID=A0ABM3VV59_ERIEU|nr:mucin-4 isoform X2 [Erinaceus europaeus]
MTQRGPFSTFSVRTTASSPHATAAISADTSSSGATSPASQSSATSSPATTVTSTVTSVTNTEATSLLMTTSLSPCTSAGSVTTQTAAQSTAPLSSTPPKETRSSPQSRQTQGTETTQRDQASPSSSVRTTASSPHPTAAISADTSSSGATSPASQSSDTSSPATTITSTVTSGANTEATSSLVPTSLSPRTTAGSVTTQTATQSTAPLSSTPAKETPTSPQGLQTQRTGPTAITSSSTISTAPTSTFVSPAVTPNPTYSGLQETSPSGVSLFPYGRPNGDTEFVVRNVDFSSPLFRPQMGFPLGSSLRDVLYFTDNGHMVFPESESQRPSFPNPPRRGFTAWDRVAVVAPFWEDADFSSGRGTVFYQVYETLFATNTLVQKVESWIERLTDAQDYKARWTLKVTWVKAPAYPAQRDLGTNTYQAVLTTDGTRAYALFLYLHGGMRWDSTQRLGNPVLMGFSSGDGHFRNSPLTSRHPWERYRPDQFLDPSSGLRGLQVFRLHAEERPNFRLQCLRWLRGEAPGPGGHPLSCPCTWQQGQWDLRFQPVHTGGWHLGSRHLCSFSSWRGGVCCSYGAWGELLEGHRAHSAWQLERELQAQDWCCGWNDRPYFCDLYQRVRPPVSCAGYRPLRPGWMFGDPHITTLDGHSFTFNGLGDFLLVGAQGGNSSFQLQGRTAQTSSAQATNFIAFAARYSGSLGNVTVQWLLKPNDTMQVLLRNQSVTLETLGVDADGQQLLSAPGVVVTQRGSQVSASFDGAAVVSVEARSDLLHASCGLPEEYRGSTEGLLGLWNGDPEDDFRMPNGSTVPPGSSEETLFHYGMSWRSMEPSLLGERDGQLPPHFTPVFLSHLLERFPNDSRVSACEGDQACIYDVLATGNSATGLATRRVLREFRRVNASAQDGTLLWRPEQLEPCTLEILARSNRSSLASVLRLKTVVCVCREEAQCLYNQTRRVGNSSLEVADCLCDPGTFGRTCEHPRDPCEELCYPGVACTPEKGCKACPPGFTGDGRHCAALDSAVFCQNKSCPKNFCYNQGHCSLSQSPDCQPTCTCPPAFSDPRCFLAGNNFTPTLRKELPLRVIELRLREEENASKADVDASVAHRLRGLDVRAFLRNSQVQLISRWVLASGRPLQQWVVISEFQYRPGGPVIDFLNQRLLPEVLAAFLLQAPRQGWGRSSGPRTNVAFYPLSAGDVHSIQAANVSALSTFLRCDGYAGYRLHYGAPSGFSCVSPCSEGYCQNGGQCQHLPQGPRCSCVPSSIYTAWGEHCENLSVKLGAFLGILFGTLGGLLLLGAAVFVVLRFWGFSRTLYSYPLDLER